MATLPNLERKPLSLDTLIARHAPARPATRAKTLPRGNISLRDLEASSALSRAPSLDAPRALVLVITVATCECGRVHRLPNTAALVRYDAAGHTNSVRYTRAECHSVELLPRERVERHVTVPFCEECF